MIHFVAFSLNDQVFSRKPGRNVKLGLHECG